MNHNPYNFIEQQIYSWLCRKFVSSSIRRVSDLPVALASDIGLQRKENQDRLLVMRFKSTSDNSDVMLIVLADGMGGMIGGADAASIALSSFSWGVINEYSGINESIDECLRKSVNYANSRVYDKYKGEGGATLSAIIMNNNGIIRGLNVGDSRIYSLSNTSIEQLTEDDTIAALAQKYKINDSPVADGFGRELVQYVGQEVPIEAHLINFSDGNINKVIITSDGAHVIGDENILKLSKGGANSAVLSKRVIELANWFGGVDNASIATIDIQENYKSSVDTEINVIQLWDAFGELRIACDISSMKKTQEINPRSDLISPVLTKEEEEDLIKKRDLKLRSINKRTTKTSKRNIRAKEKTKERDEQVNINFGGGEKKDDE